MVLLSEGGEPKLGSNINYILEKFGMIVNPDSVVASSYCGYLHPKEALITGGILNREVARVAQKDADKLSLIYPFGATLDVQSPAIPIISTGKQCFPMNRPIVAVANCFEGKGRIAVIGSYQLFEDAYLVKEDNELIAKVLLKYLLNPEFKLNQVDAEKPAVSDNHPVPDTLELASRMRGALKDTERAPLDYTALFDTSLFKFDLTHIPSVLQLYKDLSLPHQPLSLVPPEFEVPYPPFQLAAYPPQLKDPPKPALELFDLEEEFASERESLAQLTNKCSNTEEDLDSFIMGAGDILGITQLFAGAAGSSSTPAASSLSSSHSSSSTSSASASASNVGSGGIQPDAKKILEFILRNIIQFRCENQSQLL